MIRRIFERRTRLEAPAEEVYGWHARPGALERLTADDLAATWRAAEAGR